MRGGRRRMPGSSIIASASTDQRRAAPARPLSRGLAAGPRRAGLRDAGRGPRRATSIFFRNRSSGRRRRSRRARAPDGDVSRGPARRRRVRTGRARRRVGARRRASRASAAADSRSASGVERRSRSTSGGSGAARPHCGRRPSCSTRWRRRSACCCATGCAAARVSRSGWPSASHQSLDPAFLQRARRARPAGAGRLVVVLADRLQRDPHHRPVARRTPSSRRRSTATTSEARAAHARGRSASGAASIRRSCRRRRRGAGSEQSDRSADVLLDRVLQSASKRRCRQT